MPDGGLLAITGSAVGEAVHLTVGDTGIGMGEDTRARIFEPFFTTKAKGIGLGLAVTHRIVDAHGGSIAVTSHPGSGSSFLLALQPSTVVAPVAS